MEQLEVFRSQWGEATDVWLNQADASAWVASLGDHLEERMNEAMLDLDSKVPGKYENFGVRLLQPSGVQQFLPCKGRTTLAQMQRQIYEKTGVEPERQRLVHKGKLLSHHHHHASSSSSSSSPSLRRLGLTTTSSVHLFPLPVNMLRSRDAQTVLEASGAAALANEGGSAGGGDDNAGAETSGVRSSSNSSSGSGSSYGGVSSSNRRAMHGERGGAERGEESQSSTSSRNHHHHHQQQRDVSGQGAAAPPTVLDRAMVGALREAAVMSSRSSPRSARVNASSSSSPGTGAYGANTAFTDTAAGDSLHAGGSNASNNDNNTDEATALWRSTLLEDTQKYHMLLDLGVSRSTVLRKMVSDGIGSDEHSAEELLLSTAAAKAQEEEVRDEERGLRRAEEDEASEADLHIDSNKTPSPAGANIADDFVKDGSSNGNSRISSSEDSSSSIGDNASNSLQEVTSPLRESAAATHAAAAAARAQKAAFVASEAAAASQARAEARAAAAVARAQPPSAPKPLAADAKFKRMLEMGVSRSLVASTMTDAGLSESIMAEILGEDEAESSSSGSSDGSMPLADDGITTLGASDVAQSHVQSELQSSSSSSSLLGSEELEHLEALITYSSLATTAAKDDSGTSSTDSAGVTDGAATTGIPTPSASGATANAGETTRDESITQGGKKATSSAAPTSVVENSSPAAGGKEYAAPSSTPDHGSSGAISSTNTATAVAGEGSEPAAYTPFPSVYGKSGVVVERFSSLSTAVSIAAEEFADAFEAMTSPPRNNQALPLDAPINPSVSTSSMSSRFSTFLSPMKQGPVDAKAASAVGDAPLSTPISVFGGGVLVNKADAEVKFTWLLDALGIKSPATTTSTDTANRSSGIDEGVAVPPSPSRSNHEQPPAGAALSNGLA